MIALKLFCFADINTILAISLTVALTLMFTVLAVIIICFMVCVTIRQIRIHRTGTEACNHELNETVPASDGDLEANPYITGSTEVKDSFKILVVYI